MLKTMVEAVGNLVIINGKFVVIDHTDKKEDDKGIATVVNVYSLDKNEKNLEIHTVVRSFCSGSGGFFTAGKTGFSLHCIWRSNSGNDHMLKKHKQTKMVVVKNEVTDEYFLLMDEKNSLVDAREFLREVNLDKLAILPEHKYLRLPHETGLGELRVDGDPKFEVVMHSWIVAIKLQLY